jgi:sugar phosphate isomerase/epimerase
MGSMKLGISSHSFGCSAAAGMTHIKLLEFARDNGIKTVQIAHNMPIHLLKEDKVNELRDFAAQNDIEIELGTIGLKPEILIRYIELCDYFDCKLLRVITDMEGYAPTVEQSIGILNEFKPVVESKGIKIAIENHDRLKAAKLAHIVDSLDSPNIGICLDTVNSMMASEGIEYVKSILLPYVINVHIKDYKTIRVPNGMGIIVEGRAAGEGDLDIPQVLSGIKEDVSVILEMWTPPEKTVDETIAKERKWIIRSVHYLRNLIPS